MAQGEGADVNGVIRILWKHLGSNWKRVARELNFSRTDIDAIVHRDKDDLREQIYQFFEEWKMKNGSDATVLKLISAVQRADLEKDVLEEVQGGLSELNITVTPATLVQQDGTASQPRGSEHELQKEGIERIECDRSPSLPKLETAERTQRRTTSSSSEDPTSPRNSSRTVSHEEFEVGDMVMVDRKPKPWYGVIKWIGTISTIPDSRLAGIEMEDMVEGGHDGEFHGKRYFTCENGHGVIFRLSRLRRDERFGPPNLKGGSTPAGEDVEKDKDMPHAQPEEDSCVSPKPLASSPKSSQKEGNDTAFTFESSDGATLTGAVCFSCPGDVAGFIIGKDGKNRKDVESKTGTRILVQKDERDSAANTNVTIVGEKEGCQKALLQIVHNIRRKTALHTATTETIQIPSQSCGKVIGKKGANVQAIENLTGARINIERRKGIEVILNPDGPANCDITGSSDQIEKAKEMIQMSVEGEDMAQAAIFAAVMVKMMKQLTAEGFKFGSKV